MYVSVLYSGKILTEYTSIWGNMPPSDEKIRTALEMMPISVLRNLIEERNLGVSSRGSDELIEALVEDGWTESQYEELKKRLGAIKLEQDPYGRYIANLGTINQGVDRDQPIHQRLEAILETNSCVFDETGLAEPGFKIDTVNERAVRGIHWTKSINYTLSPLNEVKTKETVYATGFEFDLESHILLINCSLPAKAKNLTTTLNRSGIGTDPVGHDGLSNKKANQEVQGFIDEFLQKLLDRTDQLALDERDTSSVLEVDLVEMLVDESELQDVRIGGRTDIIDNPTVEEFREEHDARVVRLEGQFRLDGKYYDFTSGYTDGMGQVTVRKQGRVEERPELVKEAFDFVYETYDRYFVDV